MISLNLSKQKNSSLFKTAAFIDGLYFFTPILTLFLAGKGITLSDILFSQVLYSIGVFVGEIPTGVFADKFGNKLSLIIGYTMEVLCLTTILLFPLKVVFLVASLIRGISGSFLSGSDDALLYESIKVEYPREQVEFEYQKATARVASNLQIGVVTSIIISGIIMQFLHEQSYVLLIVMTLISLATVTIILSKLQDHKSSEDLDQVSELEGSHMLSAVTDVMRHIKLDVVIGMVLVVSAVTISGEYFMQSVYQIYFNDNGVAPLWIAWVLALGALGNALLLRLLYRGKENKFGPRAIVVGSAAFLGILFILLGLISNSVMLVIVFTFMISLYEIGKPALISIIQSRTPTKIRTTTLSSVSFVRRIVQIGLYWICGLLVLRIHTEGIIMTWGVYLVMGSLVSFWLLKRVESKG